MDISLNSQPKKRAKKSAVKAVKKATKKAVKKKPAKKRASRKGAKGTAIAKSGWENRGGVWKPMFLQALALNPYNIGEALEVACVTRPTYRKALDEDADFIEAFNDIRESGKDILKGRAFSIAAGKEKEVKFVGKDGRREEVTKDGQTTLRWFLEAHEPQVYNQRAIEAKAAAIGKDPIILMPDLIYDKAELLPTMEIEEDSVKAET